MNTHPPRSFGEGNGHREKGCGEGHEHAHAHETVMTGFGAGMRGSCGASISRRSASSSSVIYPVEQGAPVRRSTASFNCKIFGRGSHKREYTATYHGATLDNLTQVPDDHRCSSGWYSSLPLRSAALVDAAGWGASCCAYCLLSLCVRFLVRSRPLPRRPMSWFHALYVWPG